MSKYQFNYLPMIWKTTLLAMSLSPLLALALYGLDIGGENKDIILFIIFILSAVAFIFYMIHLFRNTLIPSKENWVLAFLFFLNIAEIMYWFKYIKDEKKYK